MSLHCRVGVVGTGYWGRNLVRNFADLGALSAVCDVNPKVLEQYAADHPDSRPFDDPAALFGSDVVDAVAIATPAVTHGELVAQALGAGKHVFVEKPLCLDISMAEQLRDLAAHQDLTLMIGHLLLYHPAFRVMQSIVASGGIGKLHYIYSTRLNLGRIRREENALWSFAPHDISMILQLTGRLPERVTASGGHHLSSEVADTTISHMTFSRGVQAHIFVSWLHPFKDQRLVVVGDEGMIVFDDVLPAPDKLLLYRHRIDDDDVAPRVHKVEPEHLTFESNEPLRIECQTFIDCVENGTKPASDADEGIGVLKVLDASHRALASGTAVYLQG